MIEEKLEISQLKEFCKSLIAKKKELKQTIKIAKA
jgi:hypothetical protein